MKLNKAEKVKEQQRLYVDFYSQGFADAYRLFDKKIKFKDLLKKIQKQFKKTYKLN